MNFQNVSSLHLVVGEGDIVKAYHLGQSLTRFKGNKSVLESNKVNSAIMYRSKLDLEEQAITQKWERPSTSRGWNTDAQVAS